MSGLYKLSEIRDLCNYRAGLIDGKTGRLVCGGGRLEDSSMGHSKILLGNGFSFPWRECIISDMYIY